MRFKCSCQSRKTPIFEIHLKHQQWLRALLLASKEQICSKRLSGRGSLHAQRLTTAGRRSLEAGISAWFVATHKAEFPITSSLHIFSKFWSFFCLHFWNMEMCEYHAGAWILVLPTKGLKHIYVLIQCSCGFASYIHQTLSAKNCIWNPDPGEWCSFASSYFPGIAVDSNNKNTFCKVSSTYLNRDSIATVCFYQFGQ